MFAIILPRLETTPRARAPFTVVFYGTGIFGCKTAQVSETPRESVRSGLPLKSRLRNIVKNSAKSVRALRNPLLYPAELRAQISDAGYVDRERVKINASTIRGKRRLEILLMAIRCQDSI
jgi:hypothetical protein